MDKAITTYPYFGEQKPIASQVFKRPNSEVRDFVVFFRVQDTAVRVIQRGTRLEIATSRYSRTPNAESPPRDICAVAQWQPTEVLMSETEPKFSELTADVKVVIEDYQERFL